MKLRNGLGLALCVLVTGIGESRAEPTTIMPGTKVSVVEKDGTTYTGSLVEIRDRFYGLTLGNETDDIPTPTITSVETAGDTRKFEPTWTDDKLESQIFQVTVGKETKSLGCYSDLTFTVKDEKGVVHKGATNTGQFKSIAAVVAVSVQGAPVDKVEAKVETPAPAAAAPPEAAQVIEAGAPQPEAVKPVEPAKPAEPAVKTEKEPAATAPVPGPDKEPASAGPGLANAAELHYNITISGRMEKDSSPAFKFDFPGGDFVCYSTGELDLAADLLDANGRKIDWDNNSGAGKNFRFERVLDKGLYGLRVRIMPNGGEGPYEIILGDGTQGRFPDKK